MKSCTPLRTGPTAHIPTERWYFTVATFTALLKYGGVQTGVGAGTAAPGTLFKLSTRSTLTVLHAFYPACDCLDGEYPIGTIEVVSGKVYGPAQGGGAHGEGVVFEFAP
jgi:hypothetical protein